MSSINLGESFAGGLRAPHYANGRLLTADDLKADQEAFLGRTGYTGEAAGSGIVRGLEVTQVANNLRVTGGLGINRKGQALCLLEESVELPLAVLPAVSGVIAGDGRFNNCGVAPAEGGSLVETGAYLLVASPVAQLQGSVSVKAIGTNAATCASRWEVEGVQFKALRLTGAPLRTANNAAGYRNRLAHWCFGTEALGTLPQDPFTFPAAYAPLDQLSEDDLPPCDLPLAVFYWDNPLLRFVDQWSVRRRVVHAFPSGPWHALAADRRVADAQARFLQFQAQIEEMRGDPGQFPNLATRYGGLDFRFLPPVGFLPIALPDDVLRRLVSDAVADVVGEDTGIPVGAQDELAAAIKARSPEGRVFDLEAFFGAKLPPRIGLVDGEHIDGWLNGAWYDEALDFETLGVPRGDDRTEVVRRQQPPAFDVYLVADALKVMVDGLVRVAFDTWSDTSVLEVGAAIKKLGATVAVKDGALQIGFGRPAAPPGILTGVAVNPAIKGGNWAGLLGRPAAPAVAAAPAAQATAAAAGAPAARSAAAKRGASPAGTVAKRAAGSQAVAAGDFFDLGDVAGVTAFLQAAQLPPLYAMFVKNARETQWVARVKR
jgi:hypothetical protein